jgi:hypothetical protein
MIMPEKCVDLMTRILVLLKMWARQVNFTVKISANVPIWRNDLTKS